MKNKKIFRVVFRCPFCDTLFNLPRYDKPIIVLTCGSCGQKTVIEKDLRAALHKVNLAQIMAENNPPTYNHSDFSSEKEYLEKISRMPITEHEAKSVDWDDFFKFDDNEGAV